MVRVRLRAALAASLAAALLLAACSGEDTTDDTEDDGQDEQAADNAGDDGDDDGDDGDDGGDDEEAADGEPIPVGIVTSTSGALGAYGEAYVEGLEAGLDHATDGTGAVDGRPIELEIIDDGGEPDQAVSSTVDLIGEGVTIVAGSVSSGVAVQLAPLAEENDVLFISGPAATDGITGINDNTFRSGRQSYQDVAAAMSLLDVADLDAGYGDM
ncbi:MAG: ABC transporter substrate-binding protein, partial [Nitriliruptoraceae bacterium]